MAKLYYTPREVAAILEISTDTVLDLVNRGSLPGRCDSLKLAPKRIRAAA